MRAEVPLATAAWHQFPSGARPAFSPGDFWLPRLDSGEAVGFRDDRHVLVASGTRAGKGVSVLIPNLCLWLGSVFVIDPKGENAMVTARRRGKGSAYCKGMGQKVRILDPFRTVESTQDSFDDLRVGYNPLDAITPRREESVDDAMRIAEALIVSESAADPFWEDSAKSLLKALILHVASWKHYAADKRNLVTVREILRAGDAETRKLMRLNSKNDTAPSGLTLLYESMQENPAFGGVVANAGVMFDHMLANAPKTMAGILQVACTNTDFMESPPMQRCLAKSDFALSELKTDPKGTSLYLCLPQRYMESHYRWLRMMVTLTLTEMERQKTQPACGHPVLTVLDEFPALRRMRVIENAAAQIAGFGVKLVFVVQTLAQLKDIYKDNWETLLANAGVKLFFGNDDHFTRKYVSELIGECEIIRTTRTYTSTNGNSTSTSDSQSSGFSQSNSSGTSSSGRNGGGNSSSTFGLSSNRSVSNTQQSSQSWSEGYAESIHKRSLVTPDEVGRLFGDRHNPAALALIAGLQPLGLMRTTYFRDSVFDGLFDPHTDHPLPPTITQRWAMRLVEQQRLEEEKRRAEARRLAEIEARRIQALEKERLFQERSWETYREREKERTEEQRKQRRLDVINGIWMTFLWSMVGLAGYWIVKKFFL
jgi:type IV secretory pathway TraG/TraD family ATPase VirD4